MMSMGYIIGEYLAICSGVLIRWAVWVYPRMMVYGILVYHKNRHLEWLTRTNPSFTLFTVWPALNSAIESPKKSPHPLKTLSKTRISTSGEAKIQMVPQKRHNNGKSEENDDKQMDFWVPLFYRNPKRKFVLQFKKMGRKSSTPATGICRNWSELVSLGHDIPFTGWSSHWSLKNCGKLWASYWVNATLVFTA